LAVGLSFTLAVPLWAQGGGEGKTEKAAQVATAEAASPAPALDPPGVRPGAPLAKFWQALLTILLAPLVLLLLALAKLAWLLLIAALCPRLVRREREILVDHPRSALGWGVLCLILVALVMALLGSAGQLGGLLAVIVGGVAGFCLLLGGAGVTLYIGRKLLSLADRTEVSVFMAVAVGTIALQLASLLPVFGQLLLLYLLLVSLGAFRLAIFSLPPAQPPLRQPEETAPPAEESP